ncbi:MAG: hypothetical protein AB7O88_26575 [Reyranellaceae bacterium]
MKIARLLACFAALLIFAATASAQTTPTRIRGTVSAIDGNVVTIATREGNTVKVRMADNWGVAMVVPVTLADIKENSFVGIASIKGVGGRLEALEVLVFPDAMRGSNEGHYPWDLAPESMMTNATVTTVVAADGGQALTLKYKGEGTQTIHVRPGVPIVTFGPAPARSDVKVGSKIFMGAQKAADGSYTAARIVIGKDGMQPPM